MDRQKVSDVAKNIFTGLKSLTYFRNDAAGSRAKKAKHEKACEKVLQDNGLTKWEPKKKPTKKVFWGYIDDPSSATDMPSMSYVPQPCGTQDNPDFILKLAPSVVLGLDSKSSKTCTPLYNSGGITLNYIYTLCSKKTNTSTLFLGKDIMTEEMNQVISQHIEEARKKDEEVNAKLASMDPFHRGVFYYTRPMIGQHGDCSYTNYFTHASREQCEENVLTYVQDMIDRAYA
jgi:hypothetical protein